MLGPVLEAVVDWITVPPSQQEDDEECCVLNPNVNGGEDEFVDVEAPRGLGGALQDGLSQVFGKLGLGGGWSSESKAANKANTRGTDGFVDITDAYNRNNAPINLCSGVLLHLFLDSSQVRVLTVTANYSR